MRSSPGSYGASSALSLGLSGVEPLEDVLNDRPRVAFVLVDQRTRQANRLFVVVAFPHELPLLITGEAPLYPIGLW